MNYCGLICEYNPFHTGHLYQLGKIKELSSQTSLNVDAIILAMSGNFVQRAEPSIVDKFIRTRIALDNGADAVIQIPTAYTICGGEKFSAAALGILSGIKNLNYLAFGCETKNFDLIEKIARLHAFENSSFKNSIARLSKEGMSYPKALALATLKECENLGYNLSDCEAIVNRPNNILAVQYLKIIYASGYNIKPIFIHRVDNYNSKNLNNSDINCPLSIANSQFPIIDSQQSIIDSQLPIIDSQQSSSKVLDNSSDEPNQQFASATAIRAALLANDVQSTKQFLPYDPSVLTENMANYALFDQLLLFAIRKAGVKKLARLADTGEGIENRLYENALKFTSITEVLENTKTKRYTYARLKRIALEALFEIDKECISEANPTYGKLLGIKQSLKKNLSDFSTNIIIKHQDTSRITCKNTKRLIEIDCLADDIHALLTTQKAGTFFKSKLIE